MTNELQNYLSDLVLLLREKVAEAKNNSSLGDEQQKGRHWGLYEALSLVHQQAIAFGIPLDEIGMKNFDPDKEVL